MEGPAFRLCVCAAMRASSDDLAKRESLPRETWREWRRRHHESRMEAGDRPEVALRDFSCIVSRSIEQSFKSWRGIGR